MTQPPRLVHGSLYGRAAHACQRSNLVDRQVADTLLLDLAGNDAKDRTLAFSVVVPQIVRQCARSAEHLAPVS